MAEPRNGHRAPAESGSMSLSSIPGLTQIAIGGYLDTHDNQTFTRYRCICCDLEYDDRLAPQLVICSRCGAHNSQHQSAAPVARESGWKALSSEIIAEMRLSGTLPQSFNPSSERRVPTAEPVRPADGIPAAARTSFAEPWSWGIATAAQSSDGDLIITVRDRTDNIVLQILGWPCNRTRDLESVERLVRCVNLCSGIPSETLLDLTEPKLELPMGAATVRN